MMKTAAVLLAFAGAASAFTGTPLASVRSSSSSLKMTVWDDYVGGVNFMGKETKFDPLGLSETYAPFVPFFRESELRHGRTAMLGVLGWVVADFARLPGDIYSFSSVPSSVEAHDSLVASGPLLQLLGWISLWDIVITSPAVGAMNKGEREPGDYTFDPLNLYPKEAEKKKEMQVKELMNGRLAMMAFGGIATQSVLNGNGFPYI